MAVYHYSTLRELYDHSTRKFSSRDSFSIYGQKKLTYSDFAQTVDRFAGLFKQYGLTHGDRIGLLGQNMPNWPAAYFAATISGMVVVPIATESAPEQFSHILDFSGAKAVVISEKYVAKLKEETAGNMNIVVRLDDLSVLHSKPDAVPAWEDRPIGPETLAVILFTSGTTSAPKGVTLTHGNLCSELHMIYETENIYPEDVFVSVLPLSHTYECTLGMLLPFMCGASVVYISRPPVGSVLSVVFREVRPTIFMSVPLIIEKICEQIIRSEIPQGPSRLIDYPTDKNTCRRISKKLQQWFGGRLRFVGIGGAKMDVEVERFLCDSGFPYIMGYGMTEASPLLAVSKAHQARLLSVGPPMKGVNIKIDSPAPVTGEGEILAKGPNITSSYYNNPEATTRAFTPDGWFRTKDVGRFDKDGYLYVEGRLDDVIIGANGENIYPEQIEDIINNDPAVKDVLVKKDGESLVALVYFNREILLRQGIASGDLDREIESLKQTLLAYVNDRVSSFSRISAVHEQQEPFEKTSSAKIKRFRYL